MTRDAWEVREGCMFVHVREMLVFQGCTEGSRQGGELVSCSRESCLLMVRLSPGRKQKRWSPICRDRKDPGKAHTQICGVGVGEEKVC